MIFICPDSPPSNHSQRTPFMLTRRRFVCVSLATGVLGFAARLPAAAEEDLQFNKTLSLTVGSSETIAFNETPSSGFRWQPEMAESTNASIVTVTDDGYPADQAVRP